MQWTTKNGSTLKDTFKWHKGKLSGTTKHWQNRVYYMEQLHDTREVISAEESLVNTAMETSSDKQYLKIQAETI